VRAEGGWHGDDVADALESGEAAGVERGEAFTDGDRRPQFPIDAVDTGVGPADPRARLTLALRAY